MYGAGRKEFEKDLIERGDSFMNIVNRSGKLCQGNKQIEHNWNHSKLPYAKIYDYTTILLPLGTVGRAQSLDKSLPNNCPFCVFS